MMKNSFSGLRKQNWLIFVIALALTACIDDVVESTPVGYVSIYNASPYEGSSLDIYLNEKKINAAVFDYSKYSGYLNFNEGSNTLKFTTSGTTTTMTEQSINVIADKTYSVFVLNDGTQFSVLSLSDISPLAVPDKSRVRFINLSPDSPAVDIVITNNAASPVFIGHNYKSFSEYIEMDSQVYSFDVINQADGTVLASVPNIVLASGKYYSLVAQGFSSAPPVGNNNKLTLKLLTN